MTLLFQAVLVKQQIVTMLGDSVSLTPKMFSSTEQAIIRSSTTTLQVSFQSHENQDLVDIFLIAKIACNVGEGPENCQLNIVDLEGTLTNVNIYCLSTVGTVNMISEAGNTLALYSDNVNVFPDNVALFRLAAGSGSTGTYMFLEFKSCTLVLHVP